VGFSRGFTPCLPAAAAEFTANVSSPPPGVAENMRGAREKMTHARRVLVFSPPDPLTTTRVRASRARRLQTKHTTRDYCARPYTTSSVF
jgi:hypothetical protein